MNLEVKHFDMLIDTLNNVLNILYCTITRLKHYEDLIEEIDKNIETIIYPMLCDISKQTGLTIEMLRNKGFYKYYNTDIKQITPNTLSDKFWSDWDGDDTLDEK